MTISTHSLLVILAHPDDESFPMGGTLAKYAAEGVRVTLICATARPVEWQSDMTDLFEGVRLAGAVISGQAASYQVYQPDYQVG